MAVCDTRYRADRFKPSVICSPGPAVLLSPDFQIAVQQAFDAWKATDPVSGLVSPLTFVPGPGDGRRRVQHGSRRA